MQLGQSACRCVPYGGFSRSRPGGCSRMRSGRCAVVATLLLAAGRGLGRSRRLVIRDRDQQPIARRRIVVGQFVCGSDLAGRGNIEAGNRCQVLDPAERDARATMRDVPPAPAQARR